MTDRPRAWLDCETTGVHDDRRCWELGLILRPAGGTRADDEEYCWLVDIEDLDMVHADPVALDVGRFWQRHPQAPQVRLDRGGRLAGVKPEWPAVPPTDPVFGEQEVLETVVGLTKGAIVMGSNPTFDIMTLAPLMSAWGIAPSWFYRPVDVPERAAGWLSGAGLPVPVNEKGDEKSDLVAKACGVDPADYERHSALGDCRLFRDLWDAIHQPSAARDAWVRAVALRDAYERLEAILKEYPIPVACAAGVDGDFHNWVFDQIDTGGQRPGAPAHVEPADALAEFGKTLSEDERRAWLAAMATPAPAVDEMTAELAKERALHQQTIKLLRLLYAVYNAWNMGCRSEPTADQKAEGYSTLLAVESWREMETACLAVDEAWPRIRPLLAEAIPNAGPNAGAEAPDA